MKIAIDARILKSTTGRYVQQLLEWLQKLDTGGNRYVVILAEKDRGAWKPKNPNFFPAYVSYKNYSLSEQLGFARFLYGLKADLVHFCMPQQPLLYFGKKVTTVHDLTLLKTYNSDKNWLVYHFKQLMGRLVFFVVARMSEKIITDANYTKNQLAQFARINPAKIQTIYLGGELTDGGPPLPYPDLQNEDFIMYVGQQSDYKNIRRLIKAHQMLLDSFPRLRLALVGNLDGSNGEPLRRNLAWCRQQGFQNVIFTGFVSDGQLAWLYQNTRAYVFPSLMEGFGLPGLEAMWHGTPVISSNTTCLPEVYGTAALYFNPLDTSDMAKKISQVLADDKLRQKLVSLGKRQAKKYSWRTTAEQTLKVYDEVLSAGR